MSALTNTLSKIFGREKVAKIDHEDKHMGETLKNQQNTVLIYCVKCRGKYLVIDPQDVTFKNGKKALTGTCSNCNKTKVFKIVKN